MILFFTILLATASFAHAGAQIPSAPREFAPPTGVPVSINPSASAPAEVRGSTSTADINTIAISSPASSFAAYAKPSQKVTEFIAIGDSYTAGVGSNGAPDYIHDSGDCSRYDKGWPLQLQNLDEWEEFNGGVLVLNFGACTGAKMQDVIDKQLNLGDGTWHDTPYHDFGRPQLAVLTISGNDVGFVSVLDACVFQFSASPPDCQTKLAEVKMIASPAFEYDLINILSKISLKGRTAGGASPPQSFQVYISEYIPFWNDANTGCNEISWSIYSWFREAKLSASLRKQMNNLVDDLNNVLRAVAEGLNGFMGTYFVDGISPPL